ncbi:hypothetical protein D3C75_768750 [compost metagenome]
MHLKRDPQLPEMLLKAGRGVVVQKDFLVQNRRAVVRQRFGGNQLLHERVTAAYGADPQTRSHIFAEAADVDYPALRIIGKKRRRRLLCEIHVAERIVLHEQTAVALRQLNQKLALPRRYGKPGRIVMRRIHVEHPWPVPAHQLLNLLQIIALWSNFHRHQPCSQTPENIHSHTVRRPLHQHRIHRPQHNARNQIDRLLSARGYQQLARRQLQPVPLPEMAAERPAQLLIPLNGGVCSHDFRIEVEHFFYIIGQEQVGQQPRIYERL